MEKRGIDVKRTENKMTSIYPPPISLQDHGEHPDMCPTAIVDGRVGCTEKQLADYHSYIRLQERALQRHFGVGNMLIQPRMDAAMDRGELPLWEDLLPRASMPPRAKMPFEFAENK
tara:strand:- start:2 stop:349 length:348 start_codon:yes stop_codon:yes gene_type:complete